MLIGNIGKDPEVRVNPNGGRKRVSFSLATSRRYRDNNGEQKEQTDWHNIIGWGKIADIVEQLGIRKGMSLYVEGSLTNRSWTDQTSGQKRYVTEINMDTFQLLTQQVVSARLTATSPTALTACSRIALRPMMQAWQKKTSIFRSNSRLCE